MKELEIKITGKVQGVGYRYFVYTVANELCLNGYVHNNLDGSVTVVVEGNEEKINELIKRLKKGNTRSFVSDIVTTEKEYTNRFSSFEILYKY